MKKILFAAAALVAMASCATEDIVSRPAPEAIGFDSAFVDNSTRSNFDPSYSNDNLFADFAVFGHVKKAVLFNKKQVTGSGINGEWTYDGTQYWVNGAKYNFAAIAPMTTTNGCYWENAVTTVNDDCSAITTEFDFRSNAVTDLLYAEAENITGKASGNTKIGFSFRHILSKVKFSFKNEYSTEVFSIKVKDIRINNAYVDGHVKVTNNATEWTASNATSNLGEIYVGHTNVDGAAYNTDAPAYYYGTTLESHHECFLIPGAVPGGYNVTFTVELWVDDIQIETYYHSAIVDFAPAPGMAYDIYAVLTPANIDPNSQQEPIEFTVTEIEDWDQYTDVDAAVMTSVATAEQLAAAVAAGESVKLEADIALTETLYYAPVTRATTIDEFVVDLNGHKISCEKDVFEVAGGTLTITGNGEVYAATTNGTPYCAVWAYGDAVVNIYGGTYKIGYPTGDYNDLIYAKDNAVINIYGGTFHNSGRDNAFVLNLKDHSSAAMNVYGGKFEKFNPADNLSEGANTNFLVEGKSVEKQDDWYIVK